VRDVRDIEFSSGCQPRDIRLSCLRDHDIGVDVPAGRDGLKDRACGINPESEQGGERVLMGWSCTGVPVEKMDVVAAIT
jgi:hypothetical protein